ncbi:TolC family outer membrane protein [Aquirhabdus parva]|uniref:Channel protein TolC n=1 Tax=Aquirhabdus parva TaxID=2283318 RepID=A0A345P380_9GAMM|nr:TolC family outer membrane protein [Aquirhabdus parva]AXI01739.1 hypothetical protein HYN46_01845 [Aquirhabdus parva]
MLLNLRLLPLTTVMVLTTSVHAMDLLETLHLANQNDPNFAAVQASRGLAEQTTAIARSSLLPQVVVNGGISRNSWNQDPVTISSAFPTVGGKTSYNSTVWGARVTQPLFNWSAYHQFKAAKSQRSRDEAKADEQSQNLMLRVAESYFNVLRAQETLILAQTREASLNKNLEETRARLHVGLIPKVDVLESEAQRDSATSERLTAENQLNSARETLNASTGVRVDSLAQLGDNLPIVAPIPNDVDAWGKLAIAKNPQLIALNYDTEANESNRTSLRSGYLPAVNLYASYNDQNNSGNSSVATALSSGKSAAVGVEARWELYAGGRTLASERQAAYQTDLSRLNLQSSQRSIENQTRTLFMTVNTDASRVQASRRNVASAEMAYNVVESGYSVGNQSMVDLLASEARLYAARRDLADSRYDYVIHSLRLHASAGVLDESVITQVNNWLVGQSKSSPNKR